MMEFYNSNYRTARKTHKCEFCGKEIAIGERYSYESGKFDGDFFERKLCIPCRKMLDAYADETGDGEFDWWWVSNYLTENYCDELCGQNKRHDCGKLPQCCNRFRIRFSEKEREQE